MTDVATDEGVDPDRQVLTRRTAMKAALGGAAATAVLNAPGIDRLTSAPAYAVSCSVNSRSGTGYNVATTGDTGGTNQVFCYGQYNSGSCNPRLNYLNFPAAGVFFEIESNGQAFNSSTPNVPTPSGSVRVRLFSGSAECDVSFNSIFCSTGTATGSFSPTSIPIGGSFTPSLGGSLGCQVGTPCTGTGCVSALNIDFVCCI